jgi:long-chain acyl-CoA synthetase
MSQTLDIIDPASVGTLAGLFRERLRRTPDAVAYRHFDAQARQWRDLRWSDMAREVARWQAAMQAEGLVAGDRVAIILRNCPEWVIFDQAAAGLGLITVPLYTQDRPENSAYILQNAGARLLLIEGQGSWGRLETVHARLEGLARILSLTPVRPRIEEPRLRTLDRWLPDGERELQARDGKPDELATIVYTSGTTGRPKGVMLSHHNILWNAHSALRLVPAYREDLFLSFLPLSHTLERTAGYYLPMMTGSTVAYNRSISELGEDLRQVRPTVLMSVPRIFERVHGKIMAGLEQKSPLARRLFRLAVETGWQHFEHRQGRAAWSPRLLLQPLLHRLVGAKVMARLGGRMSRAVVGGAPLSTGVAKLFIGLGLPMLQGYGLTETSPVLSVNRLEDNDPASVGVPLPDVELRIGDEDELLARSPGVMIGYWKDPEATTTIVDDDGWLHTGDKARIDQGHVYITGRIKEILVLSNGEKVPPADMEMAIGMDSLFEQVMVLGDNRPYLTALVVLNPEHLEPLARAKGLDPGDERTLAHPDIQQFVLERISVRLDPFPGYARVYKVHCQTRPWTVDDGLITPTLKLRRSRVMEVFEKEIDGLYRG